MRGQIPIDLVSPSELVFRTDWNSVWATIIFGSLLTGLVGGLTVYLGFYLNRRFQESQDQRAVLHKALLHLQETKEIMNSMEAPLGKSSPEAVEISSKRVEKFTSRIQDFYRDLAPVVDSPAYFVGSIAERSLATNEAEAAAFGNLDRAQKAYNALPVAEQGNVDSAEFVDFQNAVNKLKSTERICNRIRDLNNSLSLARASGEAESLLLLRYDRKGRKEFKKRLSILKNDSIEFSKNGEKIKKLMTNDRQDQHGK